MHLNVESLHCTPETNNILSQLYVNQTINLKIKLAEKQNTYIHAYIQMTLEQHRSWGANAHRDENPHN